MNDTNDGAPQPKAEYSLSGGQVLRNGQPVANYDRDSKKIEVLPEYVNFRGRISRWMRENVQDIAAIDRATAEHIIAVIEPPPVRPHIVETTMTLAAKSKSEKYDGAPPMDPMLGDKTPAFVEWLRQNHPEAFEQRYRGRKTHLD